MFERAFSPPEVNKEKDDSQTHAEAEDSGSGSPLNDAGSDVSVRIDQLDHIDH